jgi:hypothetical protein
MTIDSGWVKILKSARPAAFSSSIPTRPGTVFIDGQIKLMKGSHVRTWKQFVEMQFYNTIEKAFETGAHTVVLGFDNYQHVPTAKNMTQRKRSQHVPVVDFTSTSELPERLPEYWDAAMRNRTFKSKVMTLVCNNVRRKYADGARTVVLDFTDDVEVLGRPRELAVGARRGECDIKAFAYMDSEPLLVMSTDGDFVPLALLQIERAVQAGMPLPRVILYRIKTTQAGEKRKLGREMEYVDTTALYAFLAAELAAARPAQCFACMVAATGCDFTMNLPQLGPAKLWAHRHVLTATLAHGASPEAVLCMLLRAYTELFITRVRLTREAAPLPLDRALAATTAMLAAVQRTAQVGPRVRSAMWTPDRMLAHAKNTLWTVLYWTLLHEHPDPLGGDFGFARAAGGVDFAH